MNTRQANLKTFSDHIHQPGKKVISVDWVLWMLKTLDTDSVINPEWLRAPGRFTDDDEPPMSPIEKPSCSRCRGSGRTCKECGEAEPNCGCNDVGLLEDCPDCGGGTNES